VVAAIDQTLPQGDQLERAHVALEPQQESVVGLARVVDAVLVGDQRAAQGPQLQELLEVYRRACQAAHLQAEYQADVAQADLGQQALEAATLAGVLAAEALVVVDDQDAVGGPAVRGCPLDQLVLAGPGLDVLEDLLQTRLANINDNEKGKMVIGDFRGTRAAAGLHRSLAEALARVGSGCVSAAHEGAPGGR
jgi:hypothetical protein